MRRRFPQPLRPRFLPSLFLFGLLASAALWADAAPREPELGHPEIRNWTMRDYAAFPQNWVVRRDAEGRLYFGNRDGVLMYDGQAWRVLPLPGLFVRGLDFAADGTLYAGAVDELGYFQRNALGEWGPYVSLVPQLPAEVRPIGNLRAVYAMGDGLYFVANKCVLRWRDGHFTAWQFPGEANLISFRAADRLYVHRLGEPLQVLVNDGFTVAADRPELRGLRLSAVLPWPEGGLLLGWPDGRLAVLRGTTLTPWESEGLLTLRSQGLLGLRLLNNQYLAALTERNGVVFFDREGRFLQRVDVNAGLFNPIVRDVLMDAEGGLWFAMNHGVANVQALAGITFFDGQNGLGRSSVRSVVRHEGMLYAGTAEGVYRLKPGTDGVMARFEFVPGSEGDTTAVYSHASGLLVGTPTGLYLHPAGDGPRRRIAALNCFQLKVRSGFSDELWAATGDGVYRLGYVGGEWRVLNRLPGDTAETRTLAELPDGSLWASTPTRGLLRWTAPVTDTTTPAQVYFESANLPTKHGWMRIDRWRDQLFASNRTGFHHWDPATGQFLPFPIAEARPDESSMNVYGGDPSYLWSFFGPDRQTGHVVRIAPEGAKEALPQALVQVLGDVETLWREDRDGAQFLWVGGSYGLARVDLATALRPTPGFQTLIGRITRTREPDVRDGSFVWPHGTADLTMRFAATTYRSGNNLQFQNWLEGYDRQWGAWSVASSRELMNLSGGRYTLHVRGRDADGKIGREAAFSFIVLPPWWRTGWAYGGYLLSSLFFVTGIVRWRVHASDRERERLQQLVADRTCQLVESQQSLRQAKEAAEAANRAKSAFLANMSHELRTPLNSVLGYAQILRRSSEVGPAARRSVETIQRSGDHLLHLINEVLDLAKVEAGRMQLHEAPFALSRFTQSITDLFAVRAAEKGLAFSGPDPESLALRVQGDEQHLRQVLVNLLGNAFKFTEHGRIDWKVAAVGSNRWRFEVSDTGVGIPPAEQKMIFEPFYQSPARPLLAQQGTGLGLSISVQLVQLMGGTLGVESESGKGSRFWFELPLQALEAPVATADESAAELPLIVAYRGRRRRLLVVDDERGNRAILDEMLTPLGFVIEEADGAAAARAAVARQAPDAVLLDLRMPGDDGFVLAREWRGNGALAGGKMLALSASVLPEHQTEAIAAGCDAFLAKPFREEQLLRVIGSLLDLEWVRSGAPETTAGIVATSADIPLQWEASILQRLLSLAEHGDALRLGQELGDLARRGAAWAAAVAPWQKLAVGYQMEALSRSLGEALQRDAQTPAR